MVHELVHLLERQHNERFTALMDRFLSDWRHRRETLKSSALGMRSGPIEDIEDIGEPLILMT